jgi:DNA primase
MSDYVLDLIKKQGLTYKLSGKDYLIACLNPEHDDNNPSFRVDKITGISHCFSCGYKVNIFKHYGVVANFTSIKIAKLKDKLRNLHIDFNGVDFPEEMVPMLKPFRGITAKTLKEFGAFYTHGSEKLQDRIFFPIKDVRGKNIVYVGRHMMSQGNPRYLNYPSGVTMPIFPESFKESAKSAVLVEGIFDMLNLYDKGLHNVCCTFGTNTLFKDAALKLLALRTQGISKIYLMFDGDEAGQQAMDKLIPVLEEAQYTVEKITLEDGTDPGELSQEYVDSIKEYINEKDSNN